MNNHPFPQNPRDPFDAIQGDPFLDAYLANNAGMTRRWLYDGAAPDTQPVAPVVPLPIGQGGFTDGQYWPGREYGAPHPGWPGQDPAQWMPDAAQAVTDLSAYRAHRAHTGGQAGGHTPDATEQDATAVPQRTRRADPRPPAVKALPSALSAPGTAADTASPRASAKTVLTGHVVTESPVRVRPHRPPFSGVRPRVRSAAHTVAVTSWCTAKGASAYASHVWDWASFGTYKRAIAQAQASGDNQSAVYYSQLLSMAKDARHRRVRALPQTLAILVQLFTIFGAAGAVLAITACVVAHMAGISDIGTTMNTIGSAVTLLVWALFAVGPWALAACPVVALGLCWWKGHMLAATGAVRVPWVVTSTEDVEFAIDENAIGQALDALGIPNIKAYRKRNQPFQFLQPARRDGHGTHVIVRLPPGVTADQIIARREQLASALYRATLEVWPSQGEEAGILDLWIADKGALNGGPGPWPHLDVEHPESIDVFRGLPFGKTLRGVHHLVPIMGSNTLVGGMPGQGKSSGAKVIMAGAALDPTVELRIYVPDQNYDFDPYQPRCSRYLMGADDATIEQMMEDLRDLYADVQRRGELLTRHRVQAVTPKIARANVGLHPLVVLIEEAHLIFGHRVHGKEAGELVESIVKLCRKRGIHLIISTQAPTKDSLPRGITRNCTVGIAYAVADHVANDALLGSGAYRAGHRATDLRPGKDAGTCLVKGAGGDVRSQMVQTYRLETNDMHPVIARSLELIGKTGHGIPGAGPRTAGTPSRVTRDFVRDVYDVIDGKETRAADIPALLVKLAPNWAPYRSLTGVEVRAQLLALGIKVPSTGRTYPIRPDLLRDHLAAQSDVTDEMGAEEEAS